MRATLVRASIDLARYAMPLLLCAIAWELVARSGLIRPLFLPRFTTVVTTIGSLASQGMIFAPLGISLYRAFAGVALATVAGIVIGIGMARSRAVRWFLNPLMAVAFPAPKIAFLPMFVLWFGIGHLSKILLVAFACVFPVAIAMYSTAYSVSKFWVWSAESMGRNRLSTIMHVVLPACVPSLFASIRVTVPIALIVTFTAEMIAGGNGLGDDLTYAQRQFDTPTVYAYVTVMLLIGLVLDNAILWLRRVLLRWQDEEH
jgi:ABC-type nitrate/sulfonate/bicarbonate transport system permease component